MKELAGGGEINETELRKGGSEFLKGKMKQTIDQARRGTWGGQNTHG